MSGSYVNDFSLKGHMECPDYFVFVFGNHGYFIIKYVFILKVFICYYKFNGGYHLADDPFHRLCVHNQP